MTTVPKDAQELFNEQVPRALSRFPDQAKEVNAIYCFKVTGDGGGEWTLDLTSDPPTCTTGDTGKAQCTIEVGHDDFKDMIVDPQKGMELYFTGKLKVSGDPELATKLEQFFNLAAAGAAE